LNYTRQINDSKILELLSRLSATPFTLPLLDIFHCMFRPNWSSSDVQVLMVKDSAGHCNAVSFLPIAGVCHCFGYVGYV
jgi:hypothetical protein